MYMYTARLDGSRSGRAVTVGVAFDIGDAITNGVAAAVVALAALRFLLAKPLVAGRTRVGTDAVRVAEAPPIAAQAFLYPDPDRLARDTLLLHSGTWTSSRVLLHTEADRQKDRLECAGSLWLEAVCLCSRASISQSATEWRSGASHHVATMFAVWSKRAFAVGALASLFHGPKTFRLGRTGSPGQAEWSSPLARVRAQEPRQEPPVRCSH